MHRLPATRQKGRLMDEWEAWIVYQWDMRLCVDAVFPTELDALRFATNNGFSQRVARVVAGDIPDQVRQQEKEANRA